MTYTITYFLNTSQTPKEYMYTRNTSKLRALAKKIIIDEYRITFRPKMSCGTEHTKHVGQFLVQGPKGAATEHVCVGGILAVSRAVVHARAYTSGRTFQPNYNCFRLPACVQWSGVPSRQLSTIYAINVSHPNWPLSYTPGRVPPKTWCTSSRGR